MDTHIIDLPDPIKAKKSFGSPEMAPDPHHGGTPTNQGTSSVPPLSVDPSERLFAAEPADDAKPDRPKRWRPVLLATAAVVIVGAIGCVYLISPYNTIYPVNTARLRGQGQGQRLVDVVQQQAEALVAPAAKIASAPLPDRAAPVLPSSATASTRNEEHAEILALRDRTRLSGTPASTVETGAAGSPATGYVSNPAPVPLSNFQPQTSSPPVAPRPVALGLETGSAPHAPSPAPVASFTLSPAPAPASFAAGEMGVGLPSSPDASLNTQDRTASAQPGVQLTPVINPDPPSAAPSASLTVTSALTTKPPVQAPARAEKPADPVAVVAVLQAAPMSPPEQIQVLNEVARLAIIVRDIRAENEALKARVESTADRFDQSVADFTRRLALAEAHGAINAAMGVEPSSAAPNRTIGKGAGQAEPASPSALGGRVPTDGGTRIVPVSAVVPGPVTLAGAVRYHVTAASPGMAMLAQVDRSGGEGAQTEVKIGDLVPGYGKVTSIQQRGASWVVQTDKGPDKGVIQ